MNSLKISGGVYTAEAIKETIYSLRDRKDDSPKFREFLIETFVHKVVLYNDKIDIYYNLIKDDVEYKETVPERLESVMVHHEKELRCTSRCIFFHVGQVGYS